ncbi:hypothetical protein J6590_099177 [Homalodisca vitripennis]|nr:hypothetical protein J6590_099177 [Homalodisca vitripennis]
MVSPGTMLVVPISASSLWAYKHLKNKKSSDLLHRNRNKLNKMSKYPCGICDIGVKYQGIQCTRTCERWFHAKCLAWSSKKFKNLTDNDINTWSCDSCKPNDNAINIENLKSKNSISSLGFAYDGVPVEDLQRHFGLLPLSTRRQIADLMFLKKILSSSCDSLRLLERINLRCPRPSSRSVQLFEREFLATNYAYNSTIPRIHRLGNGLPAHIDLFSMSDTSFKREVTKYLSGHT